MQTVGQKIKILIRAAGVKQRDFAIKAGYNPDYFSGMLSGGEIADKAIEKISAVLGIDKEVLLSSDPLEYGKLPEGFGILNEPGPEEEQIRRLLEENARLADELLREREVSDDLRKVLMKIAGGGNPEET